MFMGLPLTLKNELLATACRISRLKARSVGFPSNIVSALVAICRNVLVEACRVVVGGATPKACPNDTALAVSVAIRNAAINFIVYSLYESLL